VGTDTVDFSDQVFNANDVEFAEFLLNNFIGGEGNSLLVDLAVTSLIDQVSNSGSGRITESNKGLDLLDHVKSSSVDSDEDAIVYLSESEQLEDLSDLRS